MSNERMWSHADHPGVYVDMDAVDEAGYIRVSVAALELLFEAIGYKEQTNV